jgi:hypothetical protein
MKNWDSTMAGALVIAQLEEAARNISEEESPPAPAGARTEFF